MNSGVAFIYKHKHKQNKTKKPSWSEVKLLSSSGNPTSATRWSWTFSSSVLTDLIRSGAESVTLSFCFPLRQTSDHHVQRLWSSDRQQQHHEYSTAAETPNGSFQGRHVSLKLGELTEETSVTSSHSLLQESALKSWECFSGLSKWNRNLMRLNTFKKYSGLNVRFMHLNRI